MSALANTDMLTGALSRLKIEEYLDNYIVNIHIHKKPLSVLVIDLDNLKPVNDTFGHKAGDYALQRTVELLRSNLRDDDLLGRIGGDEFLAICPNAGLKRAKSLAQRLEKTISNAKFDNLGNLTISVGAASYQEGDTSLTLINRADAKMYFYKKKKPLAKTL